MTHDEKAELRKAAEAALATGEDDAWHPADRITAHGFEWGDAKFIAKTSPETLLALLDENDKLGGWLELNRLALEEECADQNLIITLRAENARLAAEVDGLKKMTGAIPGYVEALVQASASMQHHRAVNDGLRAQLVEEKRKAWQEGANAEFSQRERMLPRPSNPYAIPSLPEQK